MLARIRQDEDGQVLVEAALLLPLWIASLLGVLQLALLQHARVLTEYASYQAARSGIVSNADPEAMRNAASFVLAPTACPSRVATLCAGGSGWARQAGGMAALAQLSAAGFPGVHVRILGPTRAEVRGELDFDRLEASAAEREATLLRIQVEYWFELKIPFVDGVIGHAYLARLGSGGARRVGSGELAAMASAGLGAGTWFVPIVAGQAMRMQSNVYERFLP